MNLSITAREDEFTDSAEIKNEHGPQILDELHEKKKALGTMNSQLLWMHSGWKRYHCSRRHRIILMLKRQQQLEQRLANAFLVSLIIELLLMLLESNISVCCQRNWMILMLKRQQMLATVHFWSLWSRNDGSCFWIANAMSVLCKVRSNVQGHCLITWSCWNDHGLGFHWPVRATWGENKLFVWVVSCWNLALMKADVFLPDLITHAVAVNCVCMLLLQKVIMSCWIWIHCLSLLMQKVAIVCPCSFSDPILSTDLDNEPTSSVSQCAHVFDGDSWYASPWS